jgi:hypothetical protein
MQYFLERFWLVGRGVRLYSPKCLEEAFSEGRMQHPAYQRSSRAIITTAQPHYRTSPIDLATRLDRCAPTVHIPRYLFLILHMADLWYLAHPTDKESVCKTPSPPLAKAHNF